MFTLKQICHLDAIIEHKTIHRAADKLHITQPALTRSLSNLESSLGVELFNRHKTGMTPTSFCLSIRYRSTQLLNLAEDLKREADLHNQLEEGELNIGLGRAVHDLLVRKVLPEFVLRYPKLNIDITSAKPEELQQALYQREIDFCLAGSGSFTQLAEIQHHKIIDIPLAILVRPHHPLAQLSQLNLAQVFKFAMLSTTTVTGAHPLREYITDAQVKNHVVCSDYVTLMQILLTSDHWLLAPAAHFSQELEQGTLLALQPEAFTAFTELSLIELQGRSRSPAMQAFIKLCNEKLTT